MVRNDISAVGDAETRPVECNDSEESKAANRWIEIALYPQDLSEIVKPVTQTDCTVLMSLRLTRAR